MKKIGAVVKDKIIFKIAEDFSSTPGPRHIQEGNFSGELFRKEYLYPIVKKALEEDQNLLVDLDGSAGYGTSFLEEAFGGLVREEKVNKDALLKILEIKSNEEDYLVDDIVHYIEDAEREKNKPR